MVLKLNSNSAVKMLKPTEMIKETRKRQVEEEKVEKESGEEG